MPLHKVGVIKCKVIGILRPILVGILCILLQKLIHKVCLSELRLPVAIVPIVLNDHLGQTHVVLDGIGNVKRVH